MEKKRKCLFLVWVLLCSNDDCICYISYIFLNSSISHSCSFHFHWVEASCRLLLIIDLLQERNRFQRQISSVTNSALVFVIMYQLCMMAYFVLKNRQEEAAVITLILVFSILFFSISYEEVYDLSKVDDEESS